MWFQIERETDCDGVRYYWSIFRGVDKLVAASTRHWDSQDEAVADASREISALGAKNVSIPLRIVPI